MSRPYVAIVSNTAPFDPEVHSRYDLYPQALRLRQDESARAEIELEVLLPVGGLSQFTEKRVLVSQQGVLLFDGVLDAAPMGLVGATVTMTAIARPPGTDAAQAQLAALGEELKTSPHWDPLFVPKGSEEDWAEILAARSSVLAFDRIQGRPFLASMADGENKITVRPFADSVEYSAEAGVARRYGLRLEARWKQLVSESFDDRGVLDNLVTYTPEGLVADFPKVGSSIGDGFEVTQSRAEVKNRWRDEPHVDRTTSVEVPAAEDEIDPAFVEEGSQIYSFDAYRMNMGLRALYRGEAERTETVELVVPVEVQPGFYVEDEEWETITLRDLTEGDVVEKWQPDTNYEKGDERVDVGSIYRARIDHFSGKVRTPGNWTLVGQSRYLASRRISSFFKSERGRQALNHALNRIIARATAAARCVHVSFETRMPRRPWLITPDTFVRVVSGKLPGGFAFGRLVSYELSWEDGRVSMSGTIACVPGIDDAPAPTLGEATGRVPSASGRFTVSVENAADDQEIRLLQQSGKPNIELPETVIRIDAAPAASTSFEQQIFVPISGKIAFSKQVQP